MESKYIVSWDNVNSICDHLAAQLKATNQTFDAIVPIARGGLVAGTIISHRFGVPTVIPITWQTRDGGQKRDTDLLKQTINHYTNVLIVDDILDSGKCLREIATVVESIPSDIRANVTYAVMFCNTSNEASMAVERTGKLLYSIPIDRNTDPRFVYFPWEV